MTMLWNVLLVEDNPGDVRIVQGHLLESKKREFSLSDVSDLATAQRRLVDETFDLVLLDLGLPDSDGLETLREVRVAAPATPVVIFTGGSSNHSAAEAIEAGAQDYLVKGKFSGELIRRVLKYAIESNRASSDRSEARGHGAGEKEIEGSSRGSAREEDKNVTDFYGKLSLRHASDQVFHLLTEEYEKLLRLALQNRTSDETPSLKSETNVLAQRLLSLAKELLILSEVKSERLELAEQSFELQKLFHSVTEILGPRIEGSRLSLDYVFPDPTLALRADEEKIKQVLLNLLSNAIRYTPAGGAVRAGFELNAGGGVDLFVSDNGSGMSPSEISGALSACEQVDSPYSQVLGDSIGLGLALSQKFAELHGGSMLIKSVQGDGTTVSVSLPVERVLVDTVLTPGI